MARLGKAIPWSYSGLTAFEQCPRRFHLTKIVKTVVDKPNEAALEGRVAHKAFEDYVAGTAAMPDKYAKFIPLGDKLRLADGTRHTEYKFGLTESLTPTGFFDSDVWLRGALDLAIIRPAEGIVLDYKTGNRKLDGDQLKLFAAASFKIWPWLPKVKTGYLWLKDMKMDTETFVPEQVPEIMQGFSARVQRMKVAQETDNWPAKPSGLCKGWCPVGRSNCEHCGE